MDKGQELIILAQRVRALSQTALCYSKNDYEIDRCHELIAIGDSITSIVSGIGTDEIAACYLPVKEYITPKVDVRSVVFNESGEVLLVRERVDGRWSLPGGWADVGYSPKEVAVKETKEETGLDVRAVRLLAVMDKRCHNHPASPFYIYKLFILCEPTGGELAKAFDILDNGFFALDELPPLSSDRILPEQILLMDKLRRDPQAPAYFD
ncbi:MAG: NUDIX hydrolase N-terminal domain-containing protein [Tannerella sp.]|jgi:ADP-ribose pyrophosphatase YjhB (NUDIX family)|nr:NUDIX hydrolase N-terminal domain-containing protein [Tannerella sp.]